MADAFYALPADPMIHLRVVEALQPIADGVGFNVAEFTFLCCVVLSWPLAFLFRLLPFNQTLRQTASIALGAFMGHLCFGLSGWVHSIISSLVVYGILAVAPSKIRTKLVYVFLFAYVTYAHYMRLFPEVAGEYPLDFTAMQMVVTIKLTSLAWNLADGEKKKESEGKKGALRPYEAAHSISELPGLMEYLAFVFFFAGYLAGPAFEFTEFRSFISGDLLKSKGNNTKKNTPVPWLQIAARLLTAAVCAVPVLMQGEYPLSYIATPEYLGSPFLTRAWFLFVAATFGRYQYYVVWNLSEITTMILGLSFSGFDSKGNMKWDRLRQCNILSTELPESPRDLLANWNMRTAAWIRYYVYNRCYPVGSRAPAWANYVAMLTSAVWHGLFPGYYITFLSGALLTETSKKLRRSFRGLVIAKYVVDDKGGRPKEVVTNKFGKLIYDNLGRIIMMTAFPYMTASFLLLFLEKSLPMMKSFLFVPHIFCIVVIVLPLPVLGTRPPRKVKAAKKKVE